MQTSKLFMSALFAATAAAALPGAALASSHREAPLLTEDPTADTTDVYLFRNGANVVMAANWIPFEVPSQGPNFYHFSENAVYRINVDNTGDAVEDIVFEFRFRRTVRDPMSFLYNTGPIPMGGLNIRQTMTVTRIEGGVSTVLATDREVAPAFVGRHSYTTPTIAPMAPATASDQANRETGESAAGRAAYDAYVTANNIHTVAGTGRVFAGPRDDPFFIDTGATFDLLRIRPGPPGNAGGGVDHLAGFNTHSIVLELPITQVARGGVAPTDPANAQSIIGIWATTHRPRVRVLRSSTASEYHGQLVQVSRLAIPLVNEVLVPQGFKDFYVGSLPRNDVANYAPTLMNNEVTRLLNALYLNGLGTPADVARVGGTLVSLLSGTFIRPAGAPAMGIVPADIMRINLAVGGSPFPTPGSVQTLGALGGDAAGFPNGRRLADDVTDIELRVLAGALDTRMAPPNNALGDGVYRNDVDFSATFPYLARPHEGYAQGTGEINPPNTAR